jgi:diadenosine tetraphosphate (Ap4A) HIT family hydrolase
MRSRSLNIYQTQSHCTFCGPNAEEVLFKSNNFYLMLSYGPITPGYLLLNSYRHFDCCGSIDECLANEFDFLVAAVRRILTEVYGHCLFYEHGKAGSCLGQSETNIHCFHAHMHCVPVNIKMNDLIDQTLRAVPLDSLSDLRQQYKSNFGPYLFVDDGRKYMYAVDKEIRSQYLRSIVATELGTDELWNWAAYPELEKVRKARETLLPVFDKLSLKGQF